MRTHFIFLFVIPICFFSCKSNSGTSTKNLTNSSQKIKVYKNYVFDLSGYEDEGGGKPFNLFDENDYVDPRSENKIAENYIPTTNPQPTIHPSIYFPINVGSRIVTDLQVPYKLSDVYLYDRSNTSDSVLAVYWQYASLEIKSCIYY